MSSFRKCESSASGELDAPPVLAAAARLNFWLVASDAAKFSRASIALVENQAVPVSHPATSGGSNRICPMFASGVSASLTEKPVQPTSLRARTTYSTGQL